MLINIGIPSLLFLALMFGLIALLIYILFKAYRGTRRHREDK